MRALITLLLLLLAVPAVLAQGLIITEPDQRAIPMLVVRGGERHRFGTGVVVGPQTILTAEHIVGDAIEVHLPRAVVTGSTSCRVGYEDIAVVTAPLPEGTPYYRPAFRTPDVGETLRVPGYPLRAWRVTDVRVVQIARAVTLEGTYVNSPVIVAEPALQPGASGSPLLDAQGHVVGIFVAFSREHDYSIAFPLKTGLRACRRLVDPEVTASIVHPRPAAPPIVHAHVAWGAYQHVAWGAYRRAPLAPAP